MSEGMTYPATQAEFNAYYASPEFDPDNDSYPPGPLPEAPDTHENAEARWAQGPVVIRSLPTIDEPLPPEVWPVPPKGLSLSSPDDGPEELPELDGRKEAAADRAQSEMMTAEEPTVFEPMSTSDFTKEIERIWGI